MKKLLATMLLAGVLSVAACGATMYSAGGSKSKLEGNGFNVSLYGYEDGKRAVEGPDYDKTPAFDNVIVATKGSGDAKDVLVAYYFSSIDAANAFLNENVKLLYDFVEANLGKNFEPKTGAHNNVTWAGSQNAFNSAF